jgi:hypothetical protein
VVGEAAAEPAWHPGKPHIVAALRSCVGPMRERDAVHDAWSAMVRLVHVLHSRAGVFVWPWLANNEGCLPKKIPCHGFFFRPPSSMALGCAMPDDSLSHTSSQNSKPKCIPDSYNTVAM